MLNRERTPVVEHEPNPVSRACKAPGDARALNGERDGYEKFLIVHVKNGIGRDGRAKLPA
jgi:hypothetical protein